MLLVLIFSCAALTINVEYVISNIILLNLHLCLHIFNYVVRKLILQYIITYINLYTHIHRHEQITTNYFFQILYYFKWCNLLLKNNFILIIEFPSKLRLVLK